LKTADTCEWFRSEPKFSKWFEKEKGNSLLWIHGSAGVGKTILATFVIDEIQSRKKGAPILYFFCNSKGNDKQRCKAVAVIRSLLYQLWKFTNTNQNFRDLWTKVNSSCAVDLQHRYYVHKYINVFRLALSRIPLVYIVIDGLDECDDRESWLSKLVGLLRGQDPEAKLTTRIKIIITSRIENNIARELLGFPFVEITSQKTRTDVDEVIEKKVESVLKSKNINPREHRELKQDIVHKLKEEADGM
jgi:Cdc6-like AAA superfamily ATPase